MIVRAHHLADDRLFECYRARRDGEIADPPTVEHLDDCGSCAARYAELAQLMDAIRAEADAEADEIFTPDRLRAQQQQIARRLEAVGRHARVITFPAKFVQRTMRGSALRPPRWTAAAAAAGLFLGIALGASYDWDWQPRPPASMAASHSRAASAPARDILIDKSDEVFLAELELAVDRPRTRELAAFDAFTPHFREIRDSR